MILVDENNMQKYIDSLCDLNEPIE